MVGEEPNVPKIFRQNDLPSSSLRKWRLAIDIRL